MRLIQRMKNILLIGAGLSSSSLIRYLLDNASNLNWHITVADNNLEQALQKVANHSLGTAVQLDITDISKTENLISSNDIVISMLPASMHISVAHLCVKHKKHLFTASYISEEMKSLNSEVVNSGLLFLNECGLDPGIDHMSAMRMMDKIRNDGGRITSFKSYCGGLISNESDNNPWHYKFTWNPMNVVLAGQHTATYKDNNQIKFVPPSRIFKETEKITLPNGEEFDGYANRDSLEYLTPYGIEDAETVIRGTLRKAGFCKSWSHLQELGLTNHADHLNLHGIETWKDLVNAFTPHKTNISLEKRVADLLNITMESEDFNRLKWLGLFSDIKVDNTAQTSAIVLLNLLKERWKLEHNDIDRIVMYHEIEYVMNNQKFTEKASLIVNGEDDTHTAMSLTVGLPLAISVKLFCQNKLKLTGVIRPTSPEIYVPVLNELEQYGIVFT